MSDYEQVPVEAAKQIAEGCAKSQVVILAWDDVHKLTHVTTYGTTAGDKLQAAEAGELLSRALELDRAQRKVYEDFRSDFDAARLKEAIELLVVICRRGGVTAPILQRAERIVKAQGRGVRQG